MNFKQVLRRAAPWLVLFVLLAGFAAVHGLAANYDIGYEITNGDFQNYNPVRRLLAGQAPYADFTVYLGAGELYSVGALLLFLGNSFGRSMFATNFCTWFYFEVLVFACCAVAMGRAKYARRLTAVLSAYFLAVIHGIPLPLGNVVSPLLGYAAKNGTSARMMRAAALPLVVLFCLWGLHAWQNCATRPTAAEKAAETAGKRRLKTNLPLPPYIIVPLLAGAFVPWSNDMGAALYIAVALGFGLYLIRIYKTDIKAILYKTLIFIGVSVLGLGLSVTIVSWGHPVAWLLQTRGTSAFQPWYYGTLAEAKLYNLSDFQPDIWFWLCLALGVVFAVGIFRCKTPRSAVLAAAGFALTLGMVLWNFLYCVLGAYRIGTLGGAQLLAAVFIPAFAVRGVMLAAGGISALQQKKLRMIDGICAGAALVLSGAVLVWGMGQQISIRIGGHGEGATFVPALGGWIGDQADKLATEQQIVTAAGGRVFSTYSSALEAMTGQFQPTGTDYIIHVLGDRQRLHYLQTFQAGEFDLVETPSVKVAPTDRWCRNANWWFYRELYRYWAPAYTTFAGGGMHLFWQRTGADNDLREATTVELAQNEAGSTVVTVTAAEANFCGVADVTLEYSVRGGGLTGNFLHITADTENELCLAAGRDAHDGDFFIPTDRERYEVPVTMSNGVGVITLDACPANAQLELRAATVNATYTDWYYFYE